jgi:PAS domain S-box-containing protein
MVFRRQNDEPGTLTFVSEGSRQLLGIAPEELTSGRRSYLSLIHPEDRPAFFAYFNATLSGSPTAHAEYRLVLDDGTIKWIWGNTHAVKAADGRIESIHGYIIDITEQRIAALRDQHRITILAALASRAPLETVMHAIVRSMEAEDPSIACSIMLLDQGGRRLRLAAAPSLPPSVQADLNEIDVCAEGGPNSVAAYTRQRTIVEDLRTHSRASSKNAQLLVHEARRLSCWAEPIFAHGGRLLGTISTIYREPHVPTAEDIDRVARAASYVTLALDLDSAIASAKESGRLAQATLDSLGAHLAVLDADGTILATNELWREYARTNLAEPEQLAQGTNHLVYLKNTGGPDRPHHLLRYHAIKGIINGSRDRWVDEFSVNVGGEERWFYSSVTRFAGAGPVRVVVSHTDITALRQAQQAVKQSQEKFASLFDFAPDALLVCDDADLILEANAQAGAMFGWAPGDLLGQSIEVLVPAGMRDAHGQLLTHRMQPEAARRMGSDRGTLLGQRRDGVTFPIELHVGPMISEKGQWAIAAIRDISERVTVLNELQRYSDELVAANRAVESARLLLEERVAVRTAELSNANNLLRQATLEAEDATRAKSAFLAAMSHEIRTPMNGVIGMIDVLTHSALTEPQQDAVATIKESAGSLLGIIDDILDFSKIEAGRLDLHPSPTSMLDLVEGVCGSLNSHAAKLGVDLSAFVSPNVPAFLNCDPTRVRQVLINLTGNAIKFSARRPSVRGSVSVRVNVATSAPLTISICVADNGIGIAPESLPRLFVAFTQAEVSTTRRYGGTGLGLAICKRLIELMRGNIAADSTIDVGSTFTVTLPLDAAEAPALRPMPQLSGLHCIVVSSPSLRAEDLQAYLEAAGATVEVAPGVGTAATIAQSIRQPVVIIEDLHPRHTTQGARLTSSGYPSNALLLLITRNQTPPADAINYYAVVTGVLRRRSLLHAVLVASGQASPELILSDRKLIETYPAPSIADARDQHMLVLVAEDDRVNQKVILTQLGLLGYAAEVASNGLEALQLWRHGDYALLLTDLHMPEMDGYALALTIRLEESKGQRMPIIALTANALVGEAHRARSAGVDEYLTKPVQLSVLGESLAKWLPHGHSAIGNPGVAETGDANVEALPLQVATLHRLIGEDPAMILEFLQDFLVVMRAASKEINAVYAAKDIPAIATIAHRLKSSARSVGALHLGDLCAELENATKAGGLVPLTQVLQEYNAASAKVEAQLVATLRDR